MQPGFIFGGGTPWTAEQLKHKREIADALLAQNMRTPQTIGDGLMAIGRALAARKLNKKADARESELRGEFDARFNSLFGGGGGNFGASGSYGGGSYTPPPPPSQFNQGETETPEQKAAREANSRTTWNGGEISDMQPNMVSTFGQESPIGGKSGYSMGTDAAPANPVAAGIVETANAIGMKPEDLATIISYETAGTFDPTKAGPTTQWGQHKGLIQFGEPQAAQYGVDWNDPLGSQLGANGAVAKYFMQNGWKPGMGMLDAYSIVNAGAPGKYNASDANNGGAPGTVADKVNNQMGGHRDNALALLGDTTGAAPQVDPLMFGQMSDPQQPQPVQMAGGAAGGGAGGFALDQGGGMDIGTLVGLMSDPMISDGQKAILNTLLTQQLQSADPMYQLQLQEQQLKLAQMQGGEGNPAAEREAMARAGGLQPGTPEWNNYVLTGELPDGGQGMRPMTPDEMAQWGIPPNSGSWGIGQDGTPKQILEAPGSRGGVEYGTSVNYYTKEDGTVGGYIIGKDGSRKEVELPEGGQFGSGTQRIDLGDRWQIIDNRTGTVLREEKKDLAAKESDEALGAAAGKVAAALPTIESNAAAALDQIDALINDPGLDAISGNVQGRLPSGIPLITGGQEGANTAAALAEIQGKLFLAAYDALRGAGAITEAEGKAATDAIANLDLTQDPKLIRAALQRAANKLRADVENARKKAAMGGGVAADTIPQAPVSGQGGPVQISTDEEYDSLPSGTQFIAPDGSTRVKP